MTQTISLHAVPRPPGGYFFQDYMVGRRFHHAVPRTLTAGDASLYIALTGARNPAHCCLPLARAMGHEAMPLDDLLVFNVAFGKTVPDVSYNAIANLGYADVRFIAPVYAGDTLTCESQVIGTKENSNGTSGIVYVRSRAFNQDREEVLSWARWVMVAMRKGHAEAHGPQVPTLPEHVDPANYQVPTFLKPLAVQPHFTGGGLLWEDYTPGEVIHHPGGMTIEESDHMMATRLYQNTARIHFDAFAGKDGPFGKRLVYGGHVISVCRALSYEGLENAFAIAAIHGGTHANPTFAGDTLYCRTVILGREKLPGRNDVGALRLRMIGAKNMDLSKLPDLGPGEKNDAVVLDLDYSVLIPRRQTP
ncbi:MAG: MaoC family dehydratase [Burkholderiales bacterium]|nr:MaoC family dehydratase [Burkholderiales bacterium]